MTTRPPWCAGCRSFISGREDYLPCHFSSIGFPLGGGRSIPCGVSYHPRCFRAGLPFTSRKHQGAGLSLPKTSGWPCFVCELCTVRAVLDRELGHPRDTWLLRLERVRILDSLHNWSSGTTRQYQSKLRQLHQFERNHPGLNILVPADFDRPARGPEIGLMWAMLQASVQPLRFQGCSSKPTASFSSIRSLRSAASQYYGWSLISSHQGSDWYFQDRRLLHGNVRPTDSAAFELFTRGLSSRLGDQSVPSTALLGRHVRGIDRYFESLYLSAPTVSARREYALAGFANLLLWFSWLRGGETFSLTWGDIDIIWPEEATAYELPRGSGALLLKLLPETKSSRARTADVPIALRSATGLDLHRWLLHVLDDRQAAPTGSDRVFALPNGRCWDLAYYRSRFLYPGLVFLRTAGDPMLQTIGNLRGNCIPDRFYSLHSYRRGARTHSQRSQPVLLHRKATDRQVNEHARWRTKRDSQPLNVQYREWSLYERLRITLYSH